MICNSSLNPRKLGLVLAVSLAAGCAAPVVAATQVAAATLSKVKLVAHRAVYDLSLKNSSDKSAIAGATGRLVFELEGDNCIGYSINMRIVTQFNTKSGLVNVVDSRSAAWESGEGEEMRFDNKQFLNSQVTEEVKGKALKGTEDKDGTAEFVKPEKSIVIPAGAVFPVEHTKRLVEAARKGDLMDRTLVFDGSEVDALYTAVSFIGKKKAPGEITLPESVKDPKMLEGQNAWPITVSYYDKESGDAASEQIPSHQISFTMFENGVSTNLTLGYEHFSLKGKLSEITFFESQACDE